MFHVEALGRRLSAGRLEDAEMVHVEALGRRLSAGRLDAETIGRLEDAEDLMGVDF